MASRKRRVITLDQKLKIIDDLKEGKSQRLVGDIHGVLAEDSTDPGYQLLTDSEIVAEVTRGGDSLDPESDDEVEPQPTVSHAQAFDAFETALKWLEGQSDTDPFHLLLVRKWRDTAAQKRVQTLKQTTLLSYLA